jgi:hypothetical protein
VPWQWRAATSRPSTRQSTQAWSEPVQVETVPQRPSNITGPQQHLHVSDTPKAQSISGALGPVRRSARRAFEVRGATFAVGRFRTRSDGEWSVGIAFADSAGGGQNGYTLPADFVALDLSKSDQLLVAWSGLPKAAAYVILGYQRHIVAWQRPLCGTAGFVLGEVNRARSRTFKAYDAQGALILKTVQHVAASV